MDPAPASTSGPVAVLTAITAAVTALAALVKAATDFAALFKRRKGGKHQAPGKDKAWLKPVLTLGLGILLGGVALVAANWTSTPPATPSPTPTVATDTATFSYTFDSADRSTMGWADSGREQAKALVRLSRTDDPERPGEGALKVELAFAGGQLHPRHRAYIQVDVKSFPPGDTQDRPAVPMTLSSPITYEFRIPRDFPVPAGYPFAIQPFVENENGKAQWGCWADIRRDDPRFTVRFDLAELCEGRSISEGFDPGQIRLIGFKVAANGKYTPRPTTQAHLFLASVSWSSRVEKR